MLWLADMSSCDFCSGEVQPSQGQIWLCGSSFSHFFSFLLLLPFQADLKTLASGCMCRDHENPPPHLRTSMGRLSQFCSAYVEVIQDDRWVKNFLQKENFLVKYFQGRIVFCTLTIKALAPNTNDL